MSKNTVWMKPPEGGPAIEVEPTPEKLTPLMVLGYQQVDAPAPTPTKAQEVKNVG